MRKAPQVYVVGLVKERAGSLADAIARGVVVPVESVEVDDRGSVYTTPPDPPSMDAPHRTVMEVMQEERVRQIRSVALTPDTYAELFAAYGIPDPDAAIPRKPLRFRCKESSCGPAPVDMDWPTADTPPRRQG